MSIFQTLRIFLWAAVHHPGFRFCWVELFVIRIRSIDDGWKFELTLRRSPRIYLPYVVQADYWKAQGKSHFLDDLPF